jgi:hypothetical protein
MKERPIIFSAPMVRAILAGTKTQTRRVVKPQPPEILPVYAPKVYWPARDRHMTHGDPDGAAYLQFERPGDYDGAHVMRGGFGFRCPCGQPGDRLWVREAWKAHTTFDHLPPREIPQSHVWYMADDGYKAESRYRQGMFMPRWASRITLEVTAVRVERLQDISEADAIAEGCTKNHNGYFWGGPHPVSGLKQMAMAGSAYRDLWESINGPGSWSTNPWVWVIEFKRVTA